MIDLYKIEGTENICSYDIDHPCYNTESTWPNFQSDFSLFKERIANSVDNNVSLLFTRVADGEFRFLERKAEGTNIGNRHLSKNIHSVDIEPFWEGIRQCDYISTQLYTEWTEEFKRVINFRDIDFPMEFAYSIVSSKWIFEKYPDSIGIIGGSEKIKLIKELMGFKEYKDYLGIERFADYISVPERYSSDNIDELENHIGRELEKSTAKVFIFGIGISKLAVAHKFKKYHKATYIDVGCGISALAGTTALERPYFGGWTNFILDDYDYSNMDRMDYKDTQGMNEIILKKMTEDYIYDGWGLCPEVFDEISKILPGGSTILELGSGSGTRILSKKYNMISIEDDPEFVGKYNSHYIDVPLIEYNSNDFPFMWDFFKEDRHWYDPKILRDKIKDAGKYDLILIDGPKGYRGGLLSHLDVFDLSKTILIDDTHDSFHYKKAEIISKMTRRKITTIESIHKTPEGVKKKFSII